MSSVVVILVVSLAGAALCAAMLLDPSPGDRLRRIGQHAARIFSVENTAVALRQADMPWMPPVAWVTGRIVISLLAALLVFGLFHLVVLGLVAAIAIHYLAGMALELRRRVTEEHRQRALLDAIRYGAVVMAKSGTATQMVEALATSGPLRARLVFAGILQGRDARDAEASLSRAVERARVRLSDPLFDDLALALTLHWRRGGRLVGSLEAVISEWDETLRLTREARALRAGIEASVLILTVLPFLFLFLLQTLAPSLLDPLRTAGGEVVFGVAIAWMVLGHRTLQGMTPLPREERLRLAPESP
jgi:Flp pilus assembly protein TadB